MGASGRAGPDPLFLQNPASAERSAGVRRENSSLQRLYCPGKGSGSSHTIGVKGCSNLRILPVLLHWACCLDVGPQRKLALMSKLTTPPPRLGGQPQGYPAVSVH